MIPKLKIPPGIPFPKTTRDPTTGMVDFDPEPIKSVIAANPDIDFSEEGILFTTITVWYQMLRADGFLDPCLEELILESVALGEPDSDPYTLQ
jgi:hypothetical protein